MIVSHHVIITGRVQGVFYRAWAQAQARELGVSGWIRNCPDGTVEANLAGEEEAVARMIQRMGEGPSNARVDAVTVEDSEAESLGRFEVRH